MKPPYQTVGVKLPDLILVQIRFKSEIALSHDTKFNLMKDVFVENRFCIRLEGFLYLYLVSFILS